MKTTEARKIGQSPSGVIDNEKAVELISTALIKKQIKPIRHIIMPYTKFVIIRCEKIQTDRYLDKDYENGGIKASFAQGNGIKGKW